MSPTDIKRGAKRSKNKRGGGSSACNTVSSCTISRAGVPATDRSLQATGTPASVMSLTTAGSCGNNHTANVTGMNGEVSMNYTQFSKGPVNPEFTGEMQTPFTFGLSERPPCTTGGRCLLCRSDRKDCPLLDSGVTGSNTASLSLSPKTDSMLQLPLWVCPDCKHNVEKDAALDQSLVNKNYLLGVPVGNSGFLEEPIGAGRLVVAVQTTPATVCTTSLTTDTMCSCEACSKQSEVEIESERESRWLQKCWSELRYKVRCIYLETGTEVSDNQDQPYDKDQEWMKELVDRLCEKDPYQLYQRLEQQAWEHVLETKVRLLKHLPEEQSPTHAPQFISLLLGEYGGLCQAARTISAFLSTLENEHLKKFQVTWELHHKHLFEKLVFSEPLLHNSFPSLVAQLRPGTGTDNSNSEDMCRALLERYQQLEQEMGVVSGEWLECEKRIDSCVDEKMLTKPQLLNEDWDFSEKRIVAEEQLINQKISLAGDNNFTDAMRKMLSCRLSVQDCSNCNYRRRCTCDDCSLSHILTCDIMDFPVTDEHPSTKPSIGFISEAQLSCMPSAGSCRNSPTILDHPLLLHTDHSSPVFGSDVALPLSSTFADIYLLNNYSDAELVASMNGVHGEPNGGAENAALNNETLPVERGGGSCSSSSELDEEDPDGESSEELSQLPLGRNSSPPPSYASQQAGQAQHTCECHVCKQNVPELRSSRLASAHQFFTEKAAHPALNLYPHIHGQHLPPQYPVPRPPLHPAVFSSLPFPHSKDPVYNCFGGSLNWNSFPHCPSQKFENIWETTMKSWNPAAFLQEALPVDTLEPELPEARPEFPSPSSGSEPMEAMERKYPAKKKCLYNFQETMAGSNTVMMATSSATSSVSCTPTTVQSSSNQMKVSSKRPAFPGDVFQNEGKEGLRHPTPVAPRNSPTCIATLPPLPAATALSPATGTHLPSVGSQPFPNTPSSFSGFTDFPPGFCPSPAQLPAAPLEGSVGPLPSTCSDPNCEGHRCEGNSGYDHQAYDEEESQDEDSCSEHSSSTCTSTNQKEGKYCDCCYCEFFGHGEPPVAPTSRNYAEIREKLRLRLTKRKEEQPKRDDQVSDREGVEDHRKVEDLLLFINSQDGKPTSSSRAAKRARHKQKKMEEKARQEAEAREVEQQLLEEQKRMEDEALKLELLRNFPAAKQKRKDTTREMHQPEAAPQSHKPLIGHSPHSPGALKGPAQNCVENLTDDQTLLLQDLFRLPSLRCGLASEHEQKPALEPTETKQNMVNGKDLRRLHQLLSQQRNGKEKLAEVLTLPESPSKGGLSCLVSEMAEKCEGTFKAKVVAVKTANGIHPEPRPTPTGDPDTEVGMDQSLPASNSEKPLNQVKEEKMVPAMGFPEVENGKPRAAESPPPKGKGKKNRKKRGDKLDNFIDDVFLPKDIDLDSVEMDETEREVEYFKRFCLDSANQTRQRLSINWSNFRLKKGTFSAH